MVQSHIYEVIITEKEFSLRRFEGFEFDGVSVKQILDHHNRSMLESYRQMIDGE